MQASHLELLCRQYLALYKPKTIHLDKLIKLATKATREAQETYQKLAEPKTCGLSAYTDYWVREVILSYLISRTLRKIPNSKSDTDFFSILPPTAIPELHRKFLTLPYTQRRANWKQAKAFFQSLEKPFVELIIDRNESALRKGYSNHIEMVLVFDQIPKQAYRGFIEKRDRVITYLRKQIPKTLSLPRWVYSEFNLPCFVCQSSFPHLTMPDGVIDLLGKEHPVLQRFRNKIGISFGDNTQTLYRKETDTFEVMLRKNSNNRHQLLELLHELGHVVTMLKDLRKGKDPLAKGRYAAEKSASNIELTTLKTLSPMAFRAHLADILLTFHRVLFELSVYANPKQHLPRLYAQIFNRCFPEANQQTNYLYLLDERIALQPLSSLAQAIAYGELLKPMLVKRGRKK
jgi:hypothetical protein